MGIFPWNRDPAKIAHKRNIEAWIKTYDEFNQLLERLEKNIKEAPNSSFYDFEHWLKGRVNGVAQPAYLPGQPKFMRYERPDDVKDMMNQGLDTLKTELTKSFAKISKAWSGYEQARANPSAHPDHPANALDGFEDLQREMRGILSFYWEFYAIIEGTQAAEAKRRETVTALQLKAEQEARQDAHLQTELQKSGVALQVEGYRHRFAEFSDMDWMRSLMKDWSGFANPLGSIIARLRAKLRANRNQT